MSQYCIALKRILCSVIKMKPLKSKISITVDDPVLEEIKLLAEQRDRSVSSYINLVLRDHLEKKKTGEKL